VTPLTRVLRLQLQLLWSSRRAPYLLVLLLGMVAIIELIVWRLSAHGVRAAELFAEMLPLLIVLGALWPTVVWRDEGPARRFAHWSMPVDVSAHDLLRVLAGALWLAAAIVAAYAAALAFAALHGTTSALVGAGALHFIGFLLAPLLTYVLVSILAVAVNRPLEWLMALYAAMVVLILLTVSGGVQVVERLFYHVLGPRPWGLWHAVYSGPESAVGDSAAAGAWLASWGVWMLIGAAGVLQATLWRRGRA
jgi:hypothetical protein